MSLTALRSPIALLLVLVCLITLLPASYGSSPSSQTSSRTPSRRGKNGTGENQETATRSSRTGASESNLPTSKGASAVSKAVLPSVPDVSTADPDQPADSSASDPSPQTRTRPEPPPFDRPSGRASRPPASSEPAQNTRSQQPTRPPQSSTDADSRTSSPATRDQDESTRGRAGEPALKRPADSRNPGRAPDSTDPERGRSNKPTLHRPGDPPDSEGANDPRSTRAPQSDPGAAPDDKDDVLKLDATLVNIPILVSDRSGRYVPQLSARDFALYEDGAQQEVAFFGSEEVPFNVALVLDMSPSVQGSSDDIQDAAIEFVRQLRPNDRVMVVSFDRRARFLTDLTNNRHVLESAIRSVSTGSGTSVYDAVYEVVDRLRQVDGRKALILFSDGEDTTSHQASYDEAIDAVTESDVLVYGLRYPGSGTNIRVNPWPRSPIPQIPFPIPFPWPWPRRRGHFTSNGPTSSNYSSAQNWPRRSRDFMTDVSNAGGGPVYDAERISDLSRLASRIADELRHVYVISYYPTNPLSNGGFRTIRVRVKGRDELAVRHRRGYNARDLKRGT